jgi:hypothetical protein
MTEEVKSDSEKKKEDWMNSKWRPMMGWLYMATCTFDFVIFPILWSLLQAVTKGQITQWQPLTLQGAGLYHIAMGAVLGLAAFGRTQEKLAGANNGGANTPSSGFAIPGAAPATPSASSFGTPNATAGFGAPAPSSFGSAPSSFGSTSPSGFGGGASIGAGSTPTLTANGKKIVPEEPQPLQ